MKLASLFFVFVVMGCTHGFGQTKITRIVHQSDYLDYGNEMLHEISTDIYLQAVSGKIHSYQDSTLRVPYSLNQVKGRGSYFEKVKMHPSPTTTKDTSVYLGFDDEASPILLEVQHKGPQTNGFSNSSMALCYNDSGTKKVLFYVKYADIQLSRDANVFLMEYLEKAFEKEQNQRWLLVNQDSIDKYVMEEYSLFVGVLKDADPRHLERYVSDRMTTGYPIDSTPAIFNSPGMKLDSNVSLGIIITEEFEREGDTMKIAKKSIGLCADILMTGSALSDVPLYYFSYTDAWLAFGFFNDSFRAGAFGFMISVSDNQFINRVSDGSKN